MDIPKDVQQTLDVPDWDAPMSITAYMSRLPPPPSENQIRVRALLGRLAKGRLWLVGWLMGSGGWFGGIWE